METNIVTITVPTIFSFARRVLINRGYKRISILSKCSALEKHTTSIATVDITLKNIQNTNNVSNIISTP